jgi:hypothetical protein
MRLLGRLEDGEYEEDPLASVHPETLQRYLVAGESNAGTRPRHRSGRSRSAEESGADSDGIEGLIAGDQARNIRHEALSVAPSQSPFENAEDQASFFVLLQQAVDEDIVSDGYGVHTSEWDGGMYPESEVIKVGARGKVNEIDLPSTTWLPRARLWVQALGLYDYMRTHGL